MFRVAISTNEPGPSSDELQKQAREALGYDVLDLWKETIYDPGALDEWVERHVEHGVLQVDFMLPRCPWAD